ncbi:LysR substrate-binding domain-containing protein [Streptomyces sp. NBC_00829]|uniref:LysR substrate-binding domain-containing protein n=1 Tax=Streptomyces sp. NBC_00829 TaxID=2903679 RepID=UPI003864DE56|nr:substrate-binding domain-containing protein [Streptomyces sp. NBC_00829]
MGDESFTADIAAVGTLLVSAVVGGAGLSVVPRYLAQEALDARKLTVLHTPTETVGNSIYLAALRGREQPPRIRAVFDLLCPSA